MIRRNSLFCETSFCAYSTLLDFFRRAWHLVGIIRIREKKENGGAHLAATTLFMDFANQAIDGFRGIWFEADLQKKSVRCASNGRMYMESNNVENIPPADALSSVPETPTFVKCGWRY